MPNCYTLPERNTYDDWAGCQAPGYTPTERQAPIVEAVAAALAAGLFYSSDVLKHCAAALHVTPEQAEHQESRMHRVEGGTLGMDCYYARRYLEAVKAREIEAADAAALRAAPGLRLGALYADGKRLLACVVESVEPGRVTVTAKRGAQAVRWPLSCTSLRYAMNRAHERGWRPAGWAEFCKGREPATSEPQP